MFRNIDNTGSRYGLGKQLGKGSFGIVCKARRVSDGKLMACKIVSISPDNVDLTLQELEVWIDAADRSSHVAKVYDAEYSKTDNEAYIYMELFEGGDARDFANELTGHRAIIHPLLLSVIAYQTALGLKQIHEKMFQHRDLKPENILMTRKITAGMNRALWDLDNRERPNERDLAAVWKIVREPRLVVLADFGLARDHKAPSRRAGMVTKVALPGGFNPAYNAPEMVKNNVQSRYADVFSLGMVIYNLATLHFPRDASERGDMPSRYPTSLRKLYLHCTEENPKRRPMAEDVVDVLDGIVDAEYQRMASPYKAWM
ncbi:kinase-like domain-containing protein [Chaetomium strumarium]|uniref:non-specific serine/threonine protein kinase n=1 Tax=Chaetomium strumarium TaxID=1170767 RepID=A0AAJ0M7H3_9PEZI|nr:kinase-like domain-containing protein [Chaetomium strumarium]